MNPILPLAALGLGVGAVVYMKKTPAAKLAETQKKQAASNYVTATWDTAMSVKDVQMALNALGASPKLAEDGQAGPKTTAAIKSFQSQAGIAIDGVVGPQTETALHHALGGANTAVTGWFLMCVPNEDECFEEEYVGAAAAERGAMGPGAGRGIKPSIEGGHMVGASWGGGDSSSWGAPSVADIVNDPQQRMQIGLLEMRRAQAQAAFPGSKAAGYDYNFLPDQGRSEMIEASQAFYGSEAERQANLNAVSGAYEEECYVAGEYDDDEEETAVAGDDWSAPDVGEIYNDPYQMAQLEYNEMHAAYPYGQPGYEYMQVQPYAAPGYFGPPYLPMPTSPQGYYAQPGVPQMGLTSAMPTLGGIPGGPTQVTNQGYEFQSSQGRKF